MRVVLSETRNGQLRDHGVLRYNIICSQNALDTAPKLRGDPPCLLCYIFSCRLRCYKTVALSTLLLREERFISPQRNCCRSLPAIKLLLNQGK